MVRSAWLFAGLVAALVASSPPAAADVPDPAHSSVDRILAVCPEGDVLFRVVARGFVGQPKAGVSITLDFASCPAFPVCPDQPGNPTSYFVDEANHQIRATTNAQGLAELPLRMGGTCPDSLVIVYGDGVRFGARSVVSPDQNGDRTVDDADLALLQSKLGRADPTGDFDGDGFVTPADVAALQAHMGHTCPAATPTHPRTWGRLKLLYR